MHISKCVCSEGVVRQAVREQIRSSVEVKQLRELIAAKSSHWPPTCTQLPSCIMLRGGPMRDKREREWLMPGFHVFKLLALSH